jgi:hypothetical protein
MRVDYREKSYRKFGQQWYEIIVHSEGAESHMRVPMLLNGELTREFPVKAKRRKAAFISIKEEGEVSLESVEEEKPKRKKKKSGVKISASAFKKLLKNR